MTNHLWSTPTHWHMAWVPYSYKKERSTPKNLQNHIFTPLLTTQQHSHQPKEITISMNTNCWLLSKPYKTGDHILLGHHTPSPSSLIMPTSHFGSTLEK